MASNPWDLMRELSSMQDRMNRIWGTIYDRGSQSDVTSGGGWAPAVDIYETAGRELVLKVEIPGMRREDIDLTVEQNTLTVKGQRRRDEAIREEQYHRTERAYGAFSRSFTLPNTLDAVNIRAEYRDGVLTVTVPVRQEAQPRQIKVELND
jgi:HSP20 family protein